MIRHLLKLVWNRKRANALIIVEIFLSFLVVFAVAAFAVASWIDYHRPTGYSYEGVWYLELTSGSEREWRLQQIPALRQVLVALSSMEEIEAVTAAANGLPMDGNTSIHGGKTTDGERINAQNVGTTPSFDEVFGVRLVAGRWFEEGDTALGYSPVVVDRDFARALYGDEDPLDKPIPMGRYGEERRIVGVIEDFRKDGELGRHEESKFFFEMVPPDDPETFLTSFALRLAPGVGPEFEEELSRRVAALAPEWTVETRTLESIRRRELRLRLAPLVAAAIVAGFLLLMVGLGLVGVLWQNVTRRTRELGLRRAVGAHRGSVHRQILLELILITTIGVAAGVLIVVQLPLLAIWQGLTPAVLAGGVGTAVAVIYLLCVLAGFYPSWMATRVQPAEALHYE